VVEPKVLVRYAGFQEVALGSLGLLRILNSESRPVRHGAGFHRLRSFADAEVASQLQFARWPSTTNVAISSRNSGVYF
jgi:hypothetical protein